MCCAGGRPQCVMDEYPKANPHMCVVAWGKNKQTKQHKKNPSHGEEILTGFSFVCISIASKILTF